MSQLENLFNKLQTNISLQERNNILSQILKLEKDK